jgi:photosystem II stability/assembly factor-like uncharacterized protein
MFMDIRKESHLSTENRHAWQQLPPLQLASPIFALTAGHDDLWAGGFGGVARYHTSKEQSPWEAEITPLPISPVTSLLALDTVLLAGGSRGIAYSYDKGASWQQADIEDGNVVITAFAASPDFIHDQTIVAATVAHGVVRTNNGGRSWINTSFGLESLEIATLAWERETIILTTFDGDLYRSRDAGRAWRAVHISEEAAIETLISLPDGIFIAVSTNAHLWNSHDQGKHWSCQDLSLPDAQVLSLFATTNGTLLLGTLEHGLLRSRDSGTTWQHSHKQVVHTCAQIGKHIYAGTDTGMNISSDDGLTWQEFPYPPLHDINTIIACGQQPLLTGAYSGIIQHASTTKWECLECIPQPLTAITSASDHSLLISSLAGLQRLSLETGTQQMLIDGESGQVAHITTLQSNTQEHIWIASANGSRLLHSIDSGQNWQMLQPPFGILPLVALQATPDKLLAATYDPRQSHVCLWHSSDEGKNWIRSVEANTSWPIVATCAYPAALSIGNILFLEQEQASNQWQKITISDDGSAIKRIRSIQMAGQTILFVLTTNGVQRSDDLGQSWQIEHLAVPGSHILDIELVGTTLYMLLTKGRVQIYDI